MMREENRMALNIRGVDCAEEIAVLRCEEVESLIGEERLGF